MIVLIIILLQGILEHGKIHAQICIHVIGNVSEKEYKICTEDSIYNVDFDNEGKACVTFASAMKAGYASLKWGQENVSLYLNRHRDLNIEIDGSMVQFSGKGAPENIYLNDRLLELRNIHWNLSEGAFLEQLENVRKQLNDHLRSLDLDPDFVVKEERRLEYVVASKIIIYPRLYLAQNRQSGYQPGEAYYDFMRHLIKDETSILDAPIYQNMLGAFVSTILNKERGDCHDAYLVLRRELDYGVEHLKDPEVLAWFVHDKILSFIEYNGVGKLDTLFPVYNRWVVDSGMRKKLEIMCSQWNGLFKGCEVPDFTWKDVRGEECHLFDFRGKFVYIDVWASWCVPCCEQWPYLKTLEEEFKGKDIIFLSLSSDKDESAWKNKVNKEKMEGILLHIAGDRSVMDHFKIRMIPRFILLDREGKIIDAMMTEPSNPETAKTLDSLL